MSAICSVRIPRLDVARQYTIASSIFIAQRYIIKIDLGRFLGGYNHIIFEHLAKELIDDYYYGRKKSDFLLDEFKKFIQRSTVKDFLTLRGYKYSF